MIIIITKQKIKKKKIKKSKHYPLKLKQIAVPNLREWSKPWLVFQSYCTPCQIYVSA